MVTPSCKRTLPRSGAGNSGKTWVTSREKKMGKWVKISKKLKHSVMQNTDTHKMLLSLVAIFHILIGGETGEMRLIN